MNGLFSIIWESIMDGRRASLHLKAMRTLRTRTYNQSSFETLVAVERDYHELTKSHYPYTWPEILRRNVALQVQTLAATIYSLYRTKSSGLSSYNLKKGVMELAHIISEGLTINNAIIFDKNYFMLSTLPPLENVRAPIRTNILNFIRTSAVWFDIRSVTQR